MEGNTRTARLITNRGAGRLCRPSQFPAGRGEDRLSSNAPIGTDCPLAPAGGEAASE